uniref:Uncharacterized protein n=1 Tax=viral metagenome TaxID=1070528 RepID=A0A6C0KFX1_9ZZZZ
MSDDGEWRALLGSCYLVGGMVCMWVCLYKYMVCHETNRHRTIAVAQPTGSERVLPQVARARASQTI